VALANNLFISMCQRGVENLLPLPPAEWWGACTTGLEFFAAESA